MLIYNPTQLAMYVKANRTLQCIPSQIRCFAYMIRERYSFPLPEINCNAQQLELERNVMDQVARGELVFVRRWVKVPACFLDGVNDGGYLSPPLPISNPPSPWDMFERQDGDLILTAPEVAAWFGFRWWAEQN